MFIITYIFAELLKAR